MNTQIKFKVLTIIANSKISNEQENILSAYIENLAGGDLIKLLSVFEKEPRAVAVYADYLEELKKQRQPASLNKLEDILTPLLRDLS